MPAVRARHLGSLGTSLCLHALVLGAAAVFGFSVRDSEPPSTFALSLRPERDPAEVLASVPITFVPVAVEELGLQEGGSLELAEPELLEAELLAEPLEVFPLAPLEQEVLASVDLAFGYPFLEGRVEAPGGATGNLAAAGAGTKANGTGTGSGPLAAGGPGGGMGEGSLAGRPGGTATSGVPPPAAPRGIVAEPVPLATPRPSYPRLAVRAGEEGSVLCRLHLDVQGSVVEVDIVESSGHDLLDRAAKDAVAGWRFEPRRVDGRPVTALVLHRITFRLTEG